MLVLSSIIGLISAFVVIRYSIGESDVDEQFNQIFEQQNNIQ